MQKFPSAHNALWQFPNKLYKFRERHLGVNSDVIHLVGRRATVWTRSRNTERVKMSWNPNPNPKPNPKPNPNPNPNPNPSPNPNPNPKPNPNPNPNPKP
jgi:hypothetical protein